MEELGEDDVPNSHIALLFLSHLKRKGYSVSYLSKGMTCLKYHPKLQSEYQDIASSPEICKTLANL